MDDTLTLNEIVSAALWEWHNDVEFVEPLSTKESVAPFMQAIEDAGYQIVPKQPSDFAIGVTVLKVFVECDLVIKDEPMKVIYKAMLEATQEKE